MALALDAGSSPSPLVETYRRLSPADTWDAARGYGWVGTAPLSRDRGAPDALRGRVVSIYLWAFAGLAPVGGLLAGWLVDIGGTALSFGVAGATGLAMTLLAGRELKQRRDTALQARLARG